MAAASSYGTTVPPSERGANATRALLNIYKKLGRTPKGGITTTSSDPEWARVEELRRLRPGAAASSSRIVTDSRLKQLKAYGVYADADLDELISLFMAWKIPEKDYKTALREWSNWARVNDVPLKSKPRYVTYIRNPRDETDNGYTEAHAWAEELADQIEIKYDRITEDLEDRSRGLEERINKIEEYNDRIKRLEQVVEDCCGSRGRHSRHTKRNNRQKKNIKKSRKIIK